MVVLVLSPLLAFALVEGGLRLAGYGYPTAFLLESEVEGESVLTDNPKFGWRFFGPAIARVPCPTVLPAAKPAGTYRIFVLGESAAYGDPHPEFGLSRMLEVLLKARWPEAQFEVVNAAMTAINSHVVLPIARDCARHESDLWVVYMGNNEVVGPFGSGTVFGRQVPRLALIRGSIAVQQSRFGQWLAGLMRRGQGLANRQAEWEGMRMFLEHRVRHDDPRMDRVYAHFARNLEDLLEAGRGRGIKIVASTVASNLKQCAPFASEHRPGLTPEQIADWTQHYQAGAAAEIAGKRAEAIEAFEKAGQIDGEFAELQFRWARCCLALGQAGEAREHFGLARDLDALRFRADRRINDLIRRTAGGREGEGIRLVDAEALLARQSADGVPGEALFYEHVHLNFDGNYLLARAVADEVATLLPATLTGDGDAPPAWLSAAECAERLAWTDWSRYETAESMIRRLNEPPFKDQSDHDARHQRLRQQLEGLLPALKPEALREAAAVHRRAIDAAPRDWALHKNLARLLQRLGDLAGAAESCREVVRRLPHCTEPRAQLGAFLTQLGRCEEALREFDAALSLKPDSVQSINGRGLALAQQGQADAALREYERSLKIDPDYGETHLRLGMLLSSLGRVEEARGHFRRALGHRLLDADAMVSLGKMCFGQGWASEAISNFTDALRLEPTHAVAHFCLGGALASVGRRFEAQTHYAEAVRLEPTLAEARLGLGIELGRQGKDEQAAEQFAEAVRLKPDLKEARLNLGIALHRRQRHEEALRQFEEVLRLDPTNSIARRYMEVARQELHR